MCQKLTFDTIKCCLHRHLPSFMNKCHSSFEASIKSSVERIKSSCNGLILFRSLTESMTPCRASKPSLTGKTWSLLSAIVASCERMRNHEKYLCILSFYFNYWKIKIVVICSQRRPESFWPVCRCYLTWVSLKSFTPTQYTEAPSWRERSACHSNISKTGFRMMCWGAYIQSSCMKYQAMRIWSR